MSASGYVAHFRARVAQDALNQATARYWLRRAEELEAARHRPGVDYVGNASAEDLQARSIRATDTAAACRNRAAVSLIQDGIEPAVLAAFLEVT